jgi:NAD(P)-dependent dehydrogenase (short-subunit alcohol dehydrogenase family)
VILNVSSGGVTHYQRHCCTTAPQRQPSTRTAFAWRKQELGPSNIRLNIVTPGPVITPGGDAIRQTFSDAMGVPAEALFTQVPLSRPGEAWEVAETVAHLASPRGAWITGHNYLVDGGMGAKQ